MIKLLKHCALAQDRLNLIIIENTIFTQYFYRIKPACVFFASKDNPTKSTMADYAHLFEVFDGYIFPSG